jgi:hypothetical protein
MLPIKSIILFNGGSAGDFLKAISLGQLNQTKNFVTVNDQGRAQLSNDYFKKLCSSSYAIKTMPVIDFIKVTQVENSHHYLPELDQLAESIWYIDYPDEIQEQIINVYIKKARKNNINFVWQREVELGILNNIPEQMKSKINQDNIVKVLNIHWLKNLRGWRNNPKLLPIQLADFFDLKKFTSIVSNVSKTSINQELLEQQYQLWYNQNSELQGIFQ